MRLSRMSLLLPSIHLSVSNTLSAVSGIAALACSDWSEGAICYWHPQCLVTLLRYQVDHSRSLVRNTDEQFSSVQELSKSKICLDTPFLSRADSIIFTGTMPAGFGTTRSVDTTSCAKAVRASHAAAPSFVVPPRIRMPS